MTSLIGGCSPATATKSNAGGWSVRDLEHALGLAQLAAGYRTRVADLDPHADPQAFGQPLLDPAGDPLSVRDAVGGRQLRLHRQLGHRSPPVDPALVLPA